MTSLVPREKFREATLFGAEVIRVSGNYDQTKYIAAHLHTDGICSSIAARESMKPMDYEIVEQLGTKSYI